jgi:transposase
MGEHLLLMALNRALQPTSKRGMERWFRSTALPRIVRGRASLSSQALWNHMDRVTPEAMRSIEVEVSKALRDRFQVEMDLLLYDPTNFSTYVQEHEGNELPQYGHAMSGRVDLRVVNLALLVARDGGLPLIHEAYRGNRHDAPQFRRSVDRLREWISLLDAEVEDLTLVFDKGNNSESNIGLLEGMRVGFVGSLRPSLHRDLLLIPLEEFTLAYRDGERETLSYRTTNEVFGARRTVVVAYNEELREAHMARLADMVEGRLRVLEEVEAGLNKGRLRTKKRVRERVQRRLKKPLLVRWKVRQRKGVLSLEYGPDPEAIEERSLGFGRTLLFTNRHGWSDGEIVRAYRE